MKKRDGIILLYSLVLIISILFVNAGNYDNTLPVCGHLPNNTIGYGQITLWLNVTYNCDNSPDDFCPEDYQWYSSSIYGDCSRCTDPDCKGNISGVVFGPNNVRVYRSEVTSHPIRYNLSALSLERSTVTNLSGEYFIANVSSGTYYFSASHEGYDTEVKEVTILRGKTAQVNFSVLNGTCYEDCTNSYGRCKAECQNFTFVNSSQNCTFYNTSVMNLCDNRLKGTEVLLGSIDPTHANFVTCCEGAPYTKYHATANITTTIKNLVKIEKLAKFNEQPVKVIMAYWPRFE